ncbi:MAG TPA: hypothetical protein VFW09_18010 [Solirubrobacteraceae bacterium]|jgi:hypothetical protein|nr:hypothetical protein [Solirubrobacteraceae bacterium]
MRAHHGRAAAALAVTAVIAGGGLAAGVSDAASTSATLRAAPARAHATPPDVTVLFGRALSKARASRRPLFAKAVVYEADGSTANGRPTRSARGITVWRFVFDNYPSHSRFASATLTYRWPAGRFGRVVGIKPPFLEDYVIRSAPKMTLATAVKRLRHAGYRQSFRFVTLRRPVGPRRVAALYLFGLSSGHYVAVNTVTGKVSPFGR